MVNKNIHTEKMEELQYEIKQINDFLDDNNCFDEYNGDIDGFIKKITENIKNLKFRKNKDNIYFISRLISRYIGFEDITFNNNDLTMLLDFIDWHYPTIIQHSEDWILKNKFFL